MVNGHMNPFHYVQRAGKRTACFLYRVPGSQLFVMNFTHGVQFSLTMAAENIVNASIE